MNLNKANRLLHRWATVFVVLPVLVMLLTGLLLQFKKQSSWIQPPTQRGVGDVPTIGFEEILRVAQDVDEAGIENWSDVSRLDVRPDKGVVKVRSISSWEVQIDLQTGDVLSSSIRRSDFIESLHDGSFFGEWVKMGIFLPAGVLMILMWVTGVYLFALPYISRHKRRLRVQKNQP
ncbi:MAG: PepSY domain-containing protein [Phycisphaerales bacterium]|nr:PepSY domain-containing protein [Phycisphaerales bacterium]